MMLRALLLLMLPFIGLGPAYAQLPGAPLNVPATLEAESATPAPGQNVTLALRFKPKPTWHGYWQNPGEAGFAMQLKWALPKGVTAGLPRYPVPSPLNVLGQMNYVFERDYAVLVDLTVDKAIASGTALPIKLRGDWLACTDEICVPEGDDLSIRLIAGDGKSDKRGQFDRYRMALPVPLDRNARYAITGKSIEIAIDYPAAAPVGNVYFFPLTEKLFRYSSPQSVRRIGDRLIIKAEISGPYNAPINGLLRFGESDTQGLNIRAVPNADQAAFPAGGTPVALVGQSKTALPSSLPMHFGWIIAFAILGGLILNLMPCVFPILGLKALALAKSGGDEGAARRDALAYTFGVIISCIGLGGMLLLLRAGGQEIGWAFQLQEPGFVLFLLLIMVAITANLAGMFDIRGVAAGDALARRGGLSGSFWTGVLAALVATPCTGPFMATAMGAALLLPVWQGLLLFAGLGLGLSIPFLLIAYSPRLRALLPRPGPWLLRFRLAMAVPMGLTALALLWLLWRLSGGNGLLIGLFAGVIVIAICTSYGRVNMSSRALGWIGAGLGVFAISYAALNQYAKPTPQSASAADTLNGEAFSPELLASYRKENRAVFVYFTADWCVTCKINEVTAISRDEVQSHFTASKIAVLRADYTRRDPVISRFLAQHGRNGVPLYLYYPAKGEAQILPQILTVDALLKL